MPEFPNLKRARDGLKESEKDRIPYEVIIRYGRSRNALSSRSLKWLWDDQ